MAARGELHNQTHRKGLQLQREGRLIASGAVRYFSTRHYTAGKCVVLFSSRQLTGGGLERSQSSVDSTVVFWHFAAMELPTVLFSPATSVLTTIIAAFIVYK